MCGSSAQENQAAAGELSFSNLLAGNYAKNFGAQSTVLSNLNNMLTPIAEAGPNQGIGGAELSTLQTQAGESVGQNYGKASQALNAQLSAQGGGNEVLPNGARDVLKGSLAASAANQLSSEDLAINKYSADVGRSNWQNATAGLQALQADYAPNAIAGEASGANSSAAGQFKSINQENNQWEGELAGVVTGGIGALAGGLGNLDKTGSSSAGEQVGNFFTGFGGQSS